LERTASFYIHTAAIVATVLAIGVFHYTTPLAFQHWHNVFQHIYYFPVVYAGLTFGWRGGVGAAIFSGVVQSFQIRLTWESMHSYAIDQLVEIPLFCSAGLLVGVLVERERKQREALKRTTRELGEVYQQLQRNFDQMKRAERLSAVGQMAAGLAHELRNPLASIAGASGILQRNARLEPKHSECLEIIDKECRRLTKLLTNFLDFARPRAVKYQTVDIEPLLNSVIELAVHAIGRRPISLRKQIQPELPTIEGDPELLKQLLLNLVINAIQAIDVSGDVILSAALRGGRMQISVKDEGCGIAPENRDKIFDPFFTTKESGTGLGLPVAHQIVEQHGGILTAESNEPKGMTFTAVLPLKHEVFG
jgi:two-component system sensor histidine kinase HydH